MSFDALNDVNWLAIVVAALAWWILGALWYARPVFGNPWMRAAGIEIQEGQRPGAATIVVPLIAQFIATVAIAMLARATGSTTFGEGIVLGLVVGVGLLLTTYLVEATFGNRPQAGTWFAITGAYQLLGVLIASVIVTVWT
jgi:Na+/H+ antiporter NhaA